MSDIRVRSQIAVLAARMMYAREEKEYFTAKRKAAAAVQALESAITPRTEFLIAHHMDALALRAGTLGHRAQAQLQQSEDFEDLMLLRDRDSAARRCGVEMPSIDEALAYLRDLEQACDTHAE